MTTCAFVLIGWVAAVTAAAAQPAPLDQLLERAGRYARGFQHDFETVIADAAPSGLVPTVVAVDGHDSLSKGEIWLTGSGIVLRTHLTIENPLTSLSSSFVVTFGRAAKFAGWFPVRMEETYTQRAPASSTDSLSTEITCSATYWNFRRFETSARVVNPR